MHINIRLERASVVSAKAVRTSSVVDRSVVWSKRLITIMVGIVAVACCVDCYASCCSSNLCRLGGTAEQT